MLLLPGGTGKNSDSPSPSRGVTLIRRVGEHEKVMMGEDTSHAWKERDWGRGKLGGGERERGKLTAKKTYGQR